MALAPVSLGQGSCPARYIAAGNCRHINCYIEPIGEDAKAGSMIVAADGLSSWVTLPATGVRAMIEVGAYLYVVSGRQIYRVAQSGAYTVLGGFPTDGPVFVARNRRDVPQIGFMSDGLFYVHDTGGSTLEQVSDTDLPPGVGFTVLDGYGIVPSESGKWNISDLENMLLWDGLDFSKTDSDPDGNKGCTTREGELVIFGEDSTEWYRDTGDVDFPYSRVAATSIGCLFSGSIQKINRSIMWIAHDATVRQMQGYDGADMTEGAAHVVRAIESVDPTTIRSCTWWRGGNRFYAISSSEWTHVLNLKTGKWHERQSYGKQRWKVSTVCKFGSRWIAGDYATGDLYEMGPSYFAEGSDPLVMTVQTPPVHAAPERLEIGTLHLGIIPGVGLNTTTPADLDPAVMVSWSDNGGFTWSNEDRIAIGRLGDVDKRGQPVHRGGTTTVHGRTFKFSMSAAVQRALTGAWIEVNKVRS